MPRAESLQRSRERLDPTKGGPGVLKSARELGKNNCLRCRRLKVKCFFEEDQEHCRRCSVSKEFCEQVQTDQSSRAKTTDAVASAAPDDRFDKMQQMILDLQKTVASLKQPESSHELIASVPTPSPSLGTASTTGHNNFSFSPGNETTTDSSSANGIVSLDELTSSADYHNLAVASLFCRAQRAIGAGLDYIVLPDLGANYEEAKTTHPILLQVLMTIATSTNATLYPRLCEQTKRRLLHAYYHENIRTLDMLQGLLLAGEYCVPFNQDACWNPHVYLSLANEVAADMGLFSDRPHLKYDNIQVHRTVLWLYFVYSLILGGSARYSVRNSWLPCHDRAKSALGNSITKDRKLLEMLEIPRLMLEMQQRQSQVGSSELVQEFQDKISNLRFQTGASKIASLCLYSCGIHLSEAHIYSHKEDVSIARIYEHKEQVKSAVMSMVDLVESMDGDPMGYPFYIIIKPIYCLIRVIKLFRHYGLDESMWLLSFADRVELALMHFANRGSAIAKKIIGKTPLIMNYWAEPSLVNDEPATIMSWALGIHWRPADPQVEQMDFLEFASMFDLDSRTMPAVEMDYLRVCPHGGT